MATLTLSADFANIADGLEAVTLQRRGTSTTVAVANALRRAVSKREVAESNGQYTASDVRWHLPIEECATSPRLGDTLVDADGTRWTVLEVTRATLGSRWACLCRDVAMVYSLDDTITIERSTLAKGTAGALEATWSTWKQVRARIQPAEATIGTQLDAQQTVRKYLVFVAEDLTLDDTCRLKDRKGTIYRITGYSGAERIGELQTIEAEVSPWSQR